MSAAMTQENDYLKYRRKCLQFCQKAVAENPDLTLVRGYYHCPIFGKQQHWWTVDKGGNIYDPTALQFPSKGTGVYEPFGGFVNCAECDKAMAEEEADFEGRYAFCSTACHMRFVGL